MPSSTNPPSDSGCTSSERRDSRDGSTGATLDAAVRFGSVCSRRRDHGSPHHKVSARGLGASRSWHDKDRNDDIRLAHPWRHRRATPRATTNGLAARSAASEETVGHFERCLARSAKRVGIRRWGWRGDDPLVTAPSRSPCRQTTTPVVARLPPQGEHPELSRPLIPAHRPHGHLHLTFIERIWCVAPAGRPNTRADEGDLQPECPRPA